MCERVSVLPVALCTAVYVYAHTSVHVSERMRLASQNLLGERDSKSKSAPSEERRGRRKTELECTFADEIFMTLNLDRLLVSVRITAAARTFMNY